MSRIKKRLDLAALTLCAVSWSPLHVRVHFRLKQISVMTFAVVKSQGIIVHENVELLFVDQI